MENTDSAKLAHYLQQIRTACPTLEIRSCRPGAGGAVNDILVINDELIFRFPMSPQGLEYMRSELAALDAIRGCLSTPVPDPLYRSPDLKSCGSAFFGYAALPGEALRHHLPLAKEEPYRSRLAHDLAAFLKGLHSVPTAPLAGIPCHDRDRRKGMQGIFAEVRELLYSSMRPDARDAVTVSFENYLGEPQQFDYAPALKHGDIGPGNILVDPVTLGISGIIDFGSAGLDDPANDLGFVSFWGENLLEKPFVERVYREYGVPHGMAHRAGFYKILIACIVAMDAKRRDDRETFDFAMMQYV